MPNDHLQNFLQNKLEIESVQQTKILSAPYKSIYSFMYELLRWHTRCSSEVNKNINQG